ncbi:type IV secretion system protein VirB10 [Nitrospirillum amazonense]|uniref:Type IV secretion system protein VirB10 n=1 Tax=Nitrospirillum amazonense TaxID=28077 RepID=A0A560K967_9PROT|nr:TrbI/VirB10 family protein [Nitrospirillum amazonense]TWB77210.1 type IV secretion system protein VirB10 [Nitrospirillum amazonense]
MTAPTPPEPGKVDPGELALRARPRRIVRFRRGLLIGVAAAGSAVILAVTIFALRGATPRAGGKQEELYSTERKPVADGLAALPGDYSRVKPDTPVLGPPLPGDLGRPMLEHQQQLGLTSATNGDRAAEAERQRRASQAVQARESGIFFRVGQVSPVAARAGADTNVEAGAKPQQDSGEGDRLALDPDRDQNNQQRKLDFVTRKNGSGTENPHALQKPRSPYTVLAGTIIAAALLPALNSDLPGLVTAQVTENVYDTATGRFLLIPQGSRLIGRYDSVVAFGQSRALLVWQRIILPDASSLEIDNLPATDAAGQAGLEDEVDYHTGRLLAGVGMATLLGVGTQISSGSNESDLVRALRESTQQNADRAGQRIVEKNLNIQPTLTVRAGWPLRVIVHKDLVLSPCRGG